MKNISTLSLSDLISGLNYLEDFEKEIDKFIVNSERINKQGEEIFSKSDIQEMVKRLDSIREKNINFRKEIQKRLLSKPEIEVHKKLYSRKSNDELIESYINTAIKSKSIPKGEKQLSKTLYKRLNDKIFLALAIKKIGDKIKSKYNISSDRIELLRELELHLNTKYNAALMQGNKLNQQVKTVEYKDEIDYEKQHKKKHKTP